MDQPVQPTQAIDVVADAKAFAETETNRITAAQATNQKTIDDLNAQIAALNSQLDAAKLVAGALSSQLATVQTLNNDIAALAVPNGSAG